MARELITTAEAAEMMRKPAATLRYYRHVGIGPRSARIGRTVVYDAAEVEAWIEAHFTEGCGAQ